MLDIVLQYVQANVEWAPFIIFGLLVLAGFNIPVSEDMMLFISGVLAAKNSMMSRICLHQRSFETPIRRSAGPTQTSSVCKPR